MLKKIFNEIKNIFLNNNVLTVISLIVFVIGVLLGVFMPVSETVSNSFSLQVNNYYVFIINI